MAVFAADNRSDNGRLIHESCKLGKDFADLDSRHIGWYRSELATDFRGSVGLDVPHVLVRRSTTEKNLNERFIWIALLLIRFGSQQIRQTDRGRSETHSTDLQKDRRDARSQ